MLGVIPNTKHTVRVLVLYSWFREIHVVYLEPVERPGNRVLPFAPRAGGVFRPVRQPGMDRRGRFR